MNDLSLKLLNLLKDGKVLQPDLDKDINFVEITAYDGKHFAWL